LKLGSERVDGDFRYAATGKRVGRGNLPGGDVCMSIVESDRADKWRERER